MTLWSKDEEARALILSELAEQERSDREAEGMRRGGQQQGPGWTWVTNLLIALVGALGLWQVEQLRGDVQKSLLQSQANAETLTELRTELTLRVETAREEHERFREAMDKIVTRLEELERRRP